MEGCPYAIQPVTGTDQDEIMTSAGAFVKTRWVRSSHGKAPQSYDRAYGHWTHSSRWLIVLHDFADFPLRECRVKNINLVERPPEESAVACVGTRGDVSA